MLICALSILFLWTSFDIIISVNDIYVTNKQINANENYILESKQNNILDVSVPMVSTDMKHNALYNSKYLDTETTESWPNKGMSLYYGVNSIIGYY